MAKRQEVRTSNKSELIYLNAIEILKESGDQGLSMRKLAERTNMSLSNLQYYFKTKDVLLAAMLDDFLARCSQQTDEFLETVVGSTREKLKAFLMFWLNNDEWMEWCTIFKELWAISQRNNAVKTSLNQYYFSYYDYLVQMIAGIARDDCDKSRIDAAASILISCSEGYFVTKEILPSEPSVLVEVLADSIVAIIQG